MYQNVPEDSQECTRRLSQLTLEASGPQIFPSEDPVIEMGLRSGAALIISTVFVGL